MFCFFFVSLLLANTCNAAHWAVLVSGSNSWENYRHQADVLHAYQILREYGFPQSHIITMIYDDIANNPSNPFKGQIFNYNGGPNVNEHVFKDYTHEFVSVENFIKVLKGDKSAPGKVLETNKNDHIFIYLVDHGGPGYFCFTNGNLWAHDLQDAFNYMHKHKLYKEITIYVESCESGSLFNGVLPNNVSIYALSASAPSESSYACCENDTINNLLCDCFSINWLLNAETHDVYEMTLKLEANIVRNLTENSTVCQYGDLKVDKSLLSSFLANKTKSLLKDKHNLKMHPAQPSIKRKKVKTQPETCSENVIDSYCMEKYIKKLKRMPTELEVSNIIEKRMCFK